MAKFWELFKKLEELPAEKQEEVQAFVAGQTALTEADKSFLNAKGLRRAMWVMTPSGVGIVTGVYADTIEVMLVDDAGLNKRTDNFETGKLSQAKVGQIPKLRRPDEAAAKAMGYL